jgi:hypothetical protein
MYNFIMRKKTLLVSSFIVIFSSLTFFFLLLIYQNKIKPTFGPDIFSPRPEGNIHSFPQIEPVKDNTFNFQSDKITQTYDNWDDLDLLSKYTLGKNVFVFNFAGFDENRITLSGQEENERSLTVIDDFMLLCEENYFIEDGKKIHSSEIYKDYSSASDESLEKIILKGLVVPVSRRKDLVSNYTVGEPVEVGLSDDYHFVNRITLFLEDPSICEK